MRVLGIIAEYNPFHNGHLYHLKESIALVKPDYVIAVLSGHFTQRGEATIVDKWARAEMALQNGIDLVIELPALYACQTAELFAYGGVQVLNNTGIVTHMSFGSEIGEIDLLYTASKVLSKEPQEYRNILKRHLSKGVSFPQARYSAVIEYLSNTNPGSTPIDRIKKVFTGSNSILALEYIKALEVTNSSIMPVTVPRIGPSYNSPDIKDKISSATAVRKELLNHGYTENLSNTLPQSSLKILKDSINLGRGPVTNHSIEQLFMGLVRRTSVEEIKNWMDVEEGLENRIKKCSLHSSCLEGLLEQTKTKRYVYTRLQRIVIHGLLGITKGKVKKYMQLGGPQYLRVLGFSKKAAPLLSQLKRTARVPLVSKAAHYYKHNDPDLNEMFEVDVLATDLYCLGFPDPNHRIGGQDFTKPIVIV